MRSVLTTLQEAVAQQLRQHLGLPGATVLARRASDLESQIEAVVQAAVGLSLIVLDPLPRRVAPAVPGPAFLEIALTVRVIENLLTNDTGASLLAAAERACQVLHLWPLPPACGDGTLLLAETDPWTTPAGNTRGATALDLHFYAASSLAAYPQN
jgi:hypothetical protein